MNHYDTHDVEKGAATQQTFDKDGSRFNKVDGDGEGSVVSNHNAVPGESFEIGTGWYARAQRLAGKLKIEQRGIERVPEDERTDAGFKALLNVATMWLSANVRATSVLRRCPHHLTSTTDGCVEFRLGTFSQKHVLPWLCGCYAGDPILQPHRYHSGLLLLDLWT
jgi:hypothetical protein